MFVTYVQKKIEHIIIDSHINGSGCAHCTKRVSKIELSWLNEMGIINDKHHRQVIIRINKKKKYIVDGFDRDNKVVYEMLGDYYHGNPEKYKGNRLNPTCRLTFGELYKRTKKKFNDITKKGYKIIYIWESDYKFNKTKKIWVTGNIL
jgi:hypothetical protein